MSKVRVVVAMSGGVDSSLAAALLRDQGYEVIGVTMRLWSEERPDILPHGRVCCSLDAADDARRVCQVLDIPYYVLDFEQDFRSFVVDYFVDEYARGRTPNPCLACNRFLKFQVLMQRARELGADFLATGHYARIVHDAAGYHLLRGLDVRKDQSYALYMVGQAELAHLLLPLGNYRKTETRRLAAAYNLAVAEKEESQEICFVPNNDYRDFLSQRIPLARGDIVDRQGRVLGRHQGIVGYTVGQRKGLGIASPEPLYVLAIDAANNRVIVGRNDELQRTTLLVRDVSFVSGRTPPNDKRVDVKVKIRYKAEAVPASIQVEDQGVRVEFAIPQRAITPGQAAVFYDGEEVLGGGTIDCGLRIGDCGLRTGD